MRRTRRLGFTLVELLTATALALLVMAILTSMFGQMTQAINEHRATIELRAELRSTATLLREDLGGLTVRTAPPRNPAHNEGYLEISEGPIGPIFWPYNRAVPTLLTDNTARQVLADQSENPELYPLWDTTLGDNDDIIMFTTRTRSEPFTGRYFQGPGGVAYESHSQVAEVCWFMRGSTLYRRMLLVGPAPARNKDPNSPRQWYWPRRWGGGPNFNAPLGEEVANAINFYAWSDVSVHLEGTSNDPDAANQMPPILVANTLGDLTKRHNRFAHAPFGNPNANPMMRNYSLYEMWGPLGLPTLGECASTAASNWRFPWTPIGSRNISNLPLNAVPGAFYDPRASVVLPSGETGLRYPFQELDPLTGEYIQYTQDPQYPSFRLSEDVVMRNVLAFDIKVWDPGAPVYRRTGGVNDGDAILPGDVDYLANIGQPPISFGAFVDLNYMSLLGGSGNGIAQYKPNYNPMGGPTPHFHGPGDPRSLLNLAPCSTTAGQVTAAVYDTWSTHYDSDGIDQDGDGTIDEGVNGWDDNPGSGAGVDDSEEREVPPPYPHPLRGVKITIRAYDEDSQSIREISIVQDFVLE